MKNLNKILLILTTLCCFIPHLTIADDSDCGIFGIDKYKQDGSLNGFSIVNQSRETDNNKFTSFLTIEEQKAIITKNDLNTAILNLKKYCCNNNLGGLSKSANTCIDDTSFYNENSLDSPYLFDHLFDVIMRRLNGLDGDKNIYTKSEMSLDEKGAERREFIVEQAISLEGANPQGIGKKYKEFRSPGYYIADKIYKFWKSGNQDFLNYVSGNGGGEESQSIAKALKEYKNWSLYDRYKNACALSEYFYILLELGGSSKDKSKISSQKCDSIVTKQIGLESQYTSTVSKNASNLFLLNYVKGFMEYLSYRQTNLEDLRKKSTDRWLAVARAVPCLQRKCTK